MLEQLAENRPTAFELYDHIVKKSEEYQVPFYGSCCIDDQLSPGVEEEDDDEDDLWERASA